MNRLRAPLLFLPILLLLALAAACGGDDDDDDTPSEAATAPRATSTTASSSPTANATDPGAIVRAIPIVESLADGQSLGKKDARVVLTVFEDFQCPHCLNYTVKFEGVIVEEFVNTGKVRLEFKQLPILGAESARAAVASYCTAEQGKFWQMHKTLFAAQADAGQLTAEKLNVGRFTDARLREYAIASGAAGPAYDACYASAAASTAVADDIRAGQALGIRGTPGFVLNGQPLTAGSPATVDAWRKFLNDAIANAK